MIQSLTNISGDSEGTCPNSNSCDYLTKEFKSGRMIQEQVAMHATNYCHDCQKYKSCPAISNGGQH